ncbi:MAG: DinB family protein [Gemmatimonadota bacterium]|nr:DinB family protein [Gemmatimonadota bacterium]
MTTPEPWLRGPIPEIVPVLQPVAHALVLTDETIRAVTADLSRYDLWRRPGGAASIGFHLAHLAGSTDRLLTYARDEQLSDNQRAALAREGTADADRPALDALLGEWGRVMDDALGQLRDTVETDLVEPRFVGRARLPSTVIGLLFHAAEHAARHTGQIVTTAKILSADR